VYITYKLSITTRKERTKFETEQNKRYITVTHGLGELIFSWNTRSKAIPFQTWTGPEGSRKLRLPDFKTISILTL